MWPFVRCCEVIDAAAAGCSFVVALLHIAAPDALQLLFPLLLMLLLLLLLLLLQWSAQLQAALAAPMQGLPLPAMLLLQLLMLRIQGRTIVCRAFLTSPRLELVTASVSTIQKYIFLFQSHSESF